MQIEAGKFYRTSDGRRVGPMVLWRGHKLAGGANWSESEGFDEKPIWNDDGISPYGGSSLVAEWQDEPTGPVRTVTRREIVPGVYAGLSIDKPSSFAGDDPLVFVQGLGHLNATQLRNIALVFSQLAEALDDNKDAGK